MSNLNRSSSRIQSQSNSDMTALINKVQQLEQEQKKIELQNDKTEQRINLLLYDNKSSRTPKKRDTSEKKKKVRIIEPPKLSLTTREKNRVLKQQVNEFEGGIKWFQQEVVRLNQIIGENKNIINNQTVVLNNLRNENENQQEREQNLLDQLTEQSQINEEAINQIQILQKQLDNHKNLLILEQSRSLKEKNIIRDEIEQFYERKLNEKVSLCTQQAQSELRVELSYKYEKIIEDLQKELKFNLSDKEKLIRKLQVLEQIIKDHKVHNQNHNLKDPHQPTSYNNNNNYDFIDSFPPTTKGFSRITINDTHSPKKKDYDTLSPKQVVFKKETHTNSHKNYLTINDANLPISRQKHIKNYNTLY